MLETVFWVFFILFIIALIFCGLILFFTFVEKGSDAIPLILRGISQTIIKTKQSWKKFKTDLKKKE